MALLEGIGIFQHNEVTKLRLDWTNGRRQVIVMRGLDGESVKEAFLATARFLNKEINNGRLE